MFLSSIFKQLLLINCAMDFVEICNVCARKVIIKAAERILILIRFDVVVVICILASFFWNTVYISGFLWQFSVSIPYV